MAAIRKQDIPAGMDAYATWTAAAREQVAAGVPALQVSPRLERRTMAMAVRYTLAMMELKAPGPGVELRVAPFGAVKILEGPASDPHNLTPPDVIELDPNVWLRLACGISDWDQERQAGHISAVGERDDLSLLLPLG